MTIRSEYKGWKIVVRGEHWFARKNCHCIETHRGEARLREKIDEKERKEQRSLDSDFIPILRTQFKKYERGSDFYKKGTK